MKTRVGWERGPRNPLGFREQVFGLIAVILWFCFTETMAEVKSASDRSAASLVLMGLKRCNL